MLQKMILLKKAKRQKMVISIQKTICPKLIQLTLDLSTLPLENWPLEKQPFITLEKCELRQLWHGSTVKLVLAARSNNNHIIFSC